MMCEERIVKMKRDMRLAKRRVRRLQQINSYFGYPDLPGPTDLPTSSESDISSERTFPTTRRLTSVESIACLRDVAARTIVLMRRNEEIQRRVEELKVETAAFLRSVMSNPENQIRLHPQFVTPTPFVTPPASEAFYSDSSDVDEDVRSLPDTENADANDSYDVELKVEVKCKREPLDDY